MTDVACKLDFVQKVFDESFIDENIVLTYSGSKNNTTKFKLVEQTMFGATKFVLIDPVFEDIVVKISANKQYHMNHKTKKSKLIKFKVTDYCRLEARFYKRAVKAGVDKVFAKTELLGVVNGHNIYSQEKVAICGYRWGVVPKDITEEEYINSRNMYFKMIEGHEFSMNSDFGGFVIRYYGAEFCVKLTEFINANKINDLGPHNCGTRSDGSPVIYDFSGYKR